MFKLRSMATLLLAFAVICTSACVYINVKDLPSHDDVEALEAEYEASAEHAEEVEILRDQIEALERENAALAEHIEALEEELIEAMHGARDDDIEERHKHEEHE